ncbi:MAG TPA: hypothetical protein VL001_01685 [Candidimonas sp.]|nr:hypothetical protein [Candidimonas sp.]
MNRHARFPASTVYWHVFAYVLLAAMVARAFIPSGYMPAAASGQSFLPGMTLCVKTLAPSVVKVLALDTSGSHNEPQSPDCAFSASFAQTLVGPSTLPLVGIIVLATHAAFRAWMPNHRHLVSVRGPPLGSRAPPGYVS